MRLFTFQEHPEKGCKMEVSQHNLAGTPNLNDGFIMVRLDQTLNTNGKSIFKNRLGKVSGRMLSKASLVLML